MSETPKPKSRKGFAAIKEKDPNRLREIARRGGMSVPADKRSFAKDRGLAARAGAMGGGTPRQK